MNLSKKELELILHLIFNYENNYHDKRIENMELQEKIENRIEDLEVLSHMATEGEK